MQITRGKIPTAKKTLIYGPEGIGKTTFASQFPNPLFIDTEGSTKELDVARFDPPSSWAMIKEDVRYVLQHPNVCRTLVIDTADWAEKMCIQSVLDEHNKNGIEDFGYGNGYRYVYEKFGELLNLLNDVIKAGINVVMTAHATLRKFEQPDELGSYDRYGMKLIDSPKTSIAAAVKEWADMVLFANYKTIVITDSKTKKTKAQGGQRIMYTTHHTCWDAKNRYDLPEELPFKYSEIQHVIESGSREVTVKFPETHQREEPAAQSSVVPKAEPMPSKSVAEPNEEAKEPQPVPETAGTVNTATDANDPTASIVKEEDLDKLIPKSLRDLMLHDQISEWDIENLVTSKGWMPYDTRIRDYESISPGFIDGAIVAQWDKVRDIIRTARKKQEIPFD